MIQPPQPDNLKPNECFIMDYDAEISYTVVLYDRRKSRRHWFRTEPNEA
jgi:hypothetical protein